MALSEDCVLRLFGGGGSDLEIGVKVWRGRHKTMTTAAPAITHNPSQARANPTNHCGQWPI